MGLCGFDIFVEKIFASNLVPTYFPMSHAEIGYLTSMKWTDFTKEQQNFIDRMEQGFKLFQNVSCNLGIVRGLSSIAFITKRFF